MPCYQETELLEACEGIPILLLLDKNKILGALQQPSVPTSDKAKKRGRFRFQFPQRL